MTTRTKLCRSHLFLRNPPLHLVRSTHACTTSKLSYYIALSPLPLLPLSLPLLSFCSSNDRPVRLHHLSHLCPSPPPSPSPRRSRSGPSPCPLSRRRYPAGGHTKAIPPSLAVGRTRSPDLDISRRSTDASFRLFEGGADGSALTRVLDTTALIAVHCCCAVLRWMS